MLPMIFHSFGSDDNRRPVEVDLLPPEPSDLVAAQAGQEQESNDIAKVFVDALRLSSAIRITRTSPSLRRLRETREPPCWWRGTD